MFDDKNERAQAVAVPLFYGIVEALAIGIYCLWAWKVGWTKAPKNENLCVVLAKCYEVEEDSGNLGEVDGDPSDVTDYFDSKMEDGTIELDENGDIIICPSEFNADNGGPLRIEDDAEMDSGFWSHFVLSPIRRLFLTATGGTGQDEAIGKGTAIDSLKGSRKRLATDSTTDTSASSIGHASSFSSRVTSPPNSNGSISQPPPTSIESAMSSSVSSGNRVDTDNEPSESTFHTANDDGACEDGQGDKAR